MDKGKIIQLLKGYLTDSKDKLETSIDYNRIEDLADDLVNLFDIHGVVSSSDKIVIELSDEEITIVTRQDLEQMKKDAIEFDGFEGWIVRGKLI